MDNGHVKEGASNLSLREEINQRMAAITPDRLILPRVKREESMTFLRPATDEIKRLHTLCDMLDNERYAIEQKNREVGRDITERYHSLGESASRKEFETPGTPLFLAKQLMTQLDEKLRRIDLLGRLAVTDVLLEIRLPHPDLDERLILVCDDWSLCHRDDKSDGRPAVITHVVFRTVPAAAAENSDEIPDKKHLH